MHLVMFDIDGTLIEFSDYDIECFKHAIKAVLHISVDIHLGSFRYVTYSGILKEILDDRNMMENQEKIVLSVKEYYHRLILTHMKTNGVSPILGAPQFIARLAGRSDVTIAVATGGWAKSAKTKLSLAGIDTANITFASASDHYSRVEIMKLAAHRAGKQSYDSITYFGDAAWDLDASLTLGYNFVLVGNRIEHSQAITDFRQFEKALSYIGLSI